MLTGRPRFLLSTLILLLLFLGACAGVTGPARRHLAAVDAAERALPLPEPERRRALEAARDELRTALVASPRLAGAKLSLATVHAWLGEPALALELAPPVGEQRPEERPAWAALGRWALARAHRWDELVAQATSDDPIRPDDPVAASPSAAAYRDFAVTASPCPTPEGATSQPSQVASAPLGPCCADAASACLSCLTAARLAWCAGAPSDSILAATEQATPFPHLELARARLRAIVFAAAGRHSDARLALETAREAALQLSSQGQTQLNLQVLALDLDRAIALAWSGEVEKARALLGSVSSASPPEPLLTRMKALSDALSPAIGP